MKNRSRQFAAGIGDLEPKDFGSGTTGFVGFAEALGAEFGMNGLRTWASLLEIMMKYPWHSLVKAGDYFIVPDEVASIHHMRIAVYVRNSRYVGLYKYECRKMVGQTAVVLTVLLDTYEPERFECKGVVSLL